jgi:hypothetical protein
VSLDQPARGLLFDVFTGLDGDVAAQVTDHRFPKGLALAMLMLLRDRVRIHDGEFAERLEASKTEAAVPAPLVGAGEYFIGATNEAGDDWIAREIRAATFEDAFAALRELAIAKWPGQFWRPTSVVEVPKLERSGPLALSMLIGRATAP